MNDQEAKDIVALWGTYFNEQMAATTQQNWMRELQRPNLHYITACNIIRAMSEMEFDKIPTFADFLRCYKETIKEKHELKLVQQQHVVSTTCTTCIGRVYLGLVMCGDEEEKSPCHHASTISGIAKAYWVHKIPCPDCAAGREACLQDHPRWMRNPQEWERIFRTYAKSLPRAKWEAEDMSAKARNEYYGLSLPARMQPGYAPDIHQMVMQNRIAAVINQDSTEKQDFQMEVYQEGEL